MACIVDLKGRQVLSEDPEVEAARARVRALDVLSLRRFADGVFREAGIEMARRAAVFRCSERQLQRDIRDPL
jgi:hypothetical protein